MLRMSVLRFFYRIIFLFISYFFSLFCGQFFAIIIKPYFFCIFFFLFMMIFSLSNYLFLNFGKKSSLLFRLFSRLFDYSLLYLTFFLHAFGNLGYGALQLVFQKFKHFFLLFFGFFLIFIINTIKKDRKST